ncbi:MAG: GNAT family N-acetyltransferase [Chloroflexi bacterium]|nr:GNAT family N-acetyltransferase [Chloroflexota bacterium]
MADRPLPRQIAARARVEYLVRPERDAEELRGLLAPQRAYAAYALGQLQPGLLERSEWWRARGAQGEALVLHSRGGLGNALFALGTVDALEAVLRLHPGPRHTFLTCQVHHIRTVLRHYQLSELAQMARMTVDRNSFRPALSEARRLQGRDVPQINRLYRSDGTPAFYNAQNIDDAVYYGIEDGRRLVAVAGTHVISRAEGIAVIGNVFVQQAHRGHGLGTQVTGAVTRQALLSCQEVALTVDPRNVAAVRAYQRLGYREVGRLFEGAATRRDLGLAAFLGRRAAALRGRRYGAELVDLPA